MQFFNHATQRPSICSKYKILILKNTLETKNSVTILTYNSEVRSSRCPIHFVREREEQKVKTSCVSQIGAQVRTQVVCAKWAH